MKKLKLLAVAAMLLALNACGFEIVDNGYRGYQTKFSEVQNDVGTLNPGWHWYNPLNSSIKEVNVQTQLYAETFHTYTKDVQQAKITVKVNYHLDPTNVHKFVQNISPDDISKILLEPALQGDLKIVVGQYEAVELISKREIATDRVFDALKKSLASNHIIVDRLELTNIDYTEAFEHSVEEKVVAIQKAVEEQNRTKQVEEVAKQTLVSAKAEAESMRIRANALSSNPKLVEFEWVKKWDGKMPSTMLGTGSNTLFNVGK